MSILSINEKKKNTNKTMRNIFCRVLIKLLACEVALSWQQIFWISLCFTEEVLIKSYPSRCSIRLTILK